MGKSTNKETINFVLRVELHGIQVKRGIPWNHRGETFPINTVSECCVLGVCLHGNFSSSRSREKKLPHLIDSKKTCMQGENQKSYYIFKHYHIFAYALVEKSVLWTFHTIISLTFQHFLSEIFTSVVLYREPNFSPKKPEFLT